MSSPSGFVVERWTRLSAVSSIVAGLVIVIMAFGPLLFSANIVDSLTTLFIYTILAAMWNTAAARTPGRRAVSRQRCSKWLTGGSSARRQNRQNCS